MARASTEAGAGKSDARGRSQVLDSVNTVDEVARFAKVSTRTVMRAIAHGKLQALRAGSQLRITDRAVWARLESGGEQ
jgi:excisionase family DNA binding protein